MNVLLSAFLSANLLLSSILSPILFTVTPNPFSNTSIRFEFDSAEAAASYYYSALRNNAISYSDSDILTMLCVLANIYVQDKDSLSSSMQDDIRFYFEHTLLGLDFWIKHDLPLFNMLGYIVKPNSSFFAQGSKWLYNRFITLSGSDPDISQLPHLYYFAYLYDNITFDRYGIEPNTSLLDDINQSVNAVQDDPFVYYSVLDTSVLLERGYSNFSDLSLYNRFVSDVSSYSQTHPVFSCFFFKYYFSNNYGPVVRVNSFTNGGNNNSFYGYVLFSIDDFNSLRVANTLYNGCTRFSYYHSDWSSFSPSFSFLGCYKDGDSFIDLVSSDIISLYYNPVWTKFSLSPSTNEGSNLDIGYLFNSFCDRQTDFLPSFSFYYLSQNKYFVNYFSSSISDFAAFKTYEDMRTYTLSNSLYFKAEPSDPVQKITYESYNSYNDLYIANQTIYNSINNYVTENNINNIDSSTQNVINNYYNFDIEFNFDLTINNIKNLQGDQETHLNNFWQSFNDSGYKNFSFTSWTNPDGTESSLTANFNPVIALINTFYNDLPSKIKMCIAGVLAVGFFGLILGVVSKMKTRGKGN